MQIPTFIINLKLRFDRLEHIKKEFNGRNEFKLNIVDAHIHKYGSIGLWNTIKHILHNLVATTEDYIIICEDDHLFTSEYSPQILIETINEAQSLYADVLSGGLSWFEDAVQISGNLFSVKKFSGTQFIVIFRKFFQRILDADFTSQDTADAKMASLSDSIYFIAPFISVQKEFGYSDATEINNGTQRVQTLFLRSAIRSKISSNVKGHFNRLLNEVKIPTEWSEYQDSVIPVYAINLPEREERRNHIINQFKDKSEFSLTIIDACKHKVGSYGHWQSVRKVVQLAIENDDDVIIICEDDHEFTSEYSKVEFIKHIYLGHILGCDYLSGGTGKFDIAIPLTKNLFWTNHCLSAQFIVVYKRFFHKILSASYNDGVIGDIKLSELSTNKMLLVPFISIQKDFGYSDVTELHNQQKGLVQQMFSTSSRRLAYMQLVYLAHEEKLINFVT